MGSKYMKVNKIQPELISGFKHFYFSLILVLILLINSACDARKDSSSVNAEGQVLKVYAHSDLQSLTDSSIFQFETRYNCLVEIEFSPRPADLIHRLIEEIDDPQADIVLGIDNGNMTRALESGVLQEYRPEGLDTIDDKYHFDGSNRLTPFNYGYLAFVYDSYEITNPPDTFGKLQDGFWRNKFLISNPETSTKGLAFLFWSIAMFGETGYGHFWRSIKNNVFFVSPTWEQSFDMFLAGEAPFLLGFTTTPAVFIEQERNYRYKTFIPGEGAYMYIEGAGIVNGSNNLYLAQKFIDYTLSRDFQQHIATSRWLYPVSERVNVPTSYKDIQVPENILNNRIRRNLTADRVESWVNRWTSLMID